MQVYVYILNDREKNLVDDHRQEVQRHAAWELKKKNCEHRWRYDGHHHNDDSYICTKCGEVKYE